MVGEASNGGWERGGKETGCWVIPPQLPHCMGYYIRPLPGGLPPVKIANIFNKLVENLIKK